MIRIMTYNVMLGNRLGEILLRIKDNPRCDVYCFQEFPESKVASFQTAMGRNWRGKFIKTLNWFGKVYGQMTIINVHTIMLIDNAEISFGTVNEFMPFDERGKIKLRYYMHGRNRNALVTIVSKGGHTVCIVNLHLPTFQLNRVKKRQIEMTVERIGKVNNCIVLGDFNYPIGRLDAFMSTRGFKHATKGVVSKRLFKFIPWQLDYVFYKGVKILDIGFEESDLSDHYPIILSMGF